MKTFIGLLLLGLLSIASAQVTYTMNFTESDLNISSITAKDGNVFEKISLKNVYPGLKVGTPALPTTSACFIIPFNQSISDILITVNSEKEILLDNKIYPVQTDLDQSKTSDEINYSPRVYESNAVWPENYAKLISSGYFDFNTHVANISICPFRYLPGENKLYFITSLTINLLCANTNNIEYIHERRKTAEQIRFFDTILSRMVQNPEKIRDYRGKADLDLLKKESVFLNNLDNTLPYYEYVIITREGELASSFKNFIDWKKRKGLDIGVVTVEEIAANDNYTSDEFTGIDDLAGKIREYLYKAKRDGNTVWVLLGGIGTDGNNGIVPIRYGTRLTDDGSDNGQVPTDLYFSSFGHHSPSESGNDDWDEDDDNFLGEPNLINRSSGEFLGGDNIDYYPEIYVGRIPCQNAQDVLDWTETVIRYESLKDVVDFNYLTQAFIIEADQLQDFGRAGHELPFDLVDYNIIVRKLWQEIDSSATPNGGAEHPIGPESGEILADMNAHPDGLIIVNAHGSERGFVYRSKFYNEYPKSAIVTREVESYEAIQDVLIIDENRKKTPSLIILNGCKNLSFDYTWDTEMPPLVGWSMIIGQQLGPAVFGYCYGFGTTSAVQHAQDILSFLFTGALRYDYRVFKIEQRGSKDDIYISSAPKNIYKNFESEFISDFIDVDSSGTSVYYWNWKLSLTSEEGSYIFAYNNNLYGKNQSLWLLKIDDLPNSVNWIYNEDGTIPGLLEVNTIDSDHYYHHTEMEIRYSLSDETSSLNKFPQKKINIFNRLNLDLDIPHYHLGVINAQTKSMSGQKIAFAGHPNIDNWGYHELNLDHNLMGDPELEAWGKVPDQFTLVEIGDDKYNNLITVDAGIEASAICLTSTSESKKPYFDVYKNSQTVTFTGVKVENRPLRLTITRSQYKPFDITGYDLSTSHSTRPETPGKYELIQNYPNPFNARTIIEYELSERCKYKIDIYNNIGQKIINLVSAEQDAGYYIVEWDATSMASGIYYYRLSTNNGQIKTRKMILIK